MDFCYFAYDATGLILSVKHDFIGIFLLHRLRVTFDSMITARQALSNDPKDFMKTLINEINDDEALGIDIEIQISEYSHDSHSIELVKPLGLDLGQVLQPVALSSL